MYSASRSLTSPPAVNPSSEAAAYPPVTPKATLHVVAAHDRLHADLEAVIRRGERGAAAGGAEVGHGGRGRGEGPATAAGALVAHDLLVIVLRRVQVREACRVLRADVERFRQFRCAQEADNSELWQPIVDVLVALITAELASWAAYRELHGLDLSG